MTAPHDGAVGDKRKSYEPASVGYPLAETLAAVVFRTQYEETGRVGRLMVGAELGMEACDAIAAAVLAAGYLPPSEVARLRADAAASALREAAAAMGKRARDDRNASHWRAHAWGNWLRDRAASLPVPSFSDENGGQE